MASARSEKAVKQVMQEIKAAGRPSETKIVSIGGVDFELRSIPTSGNVIIRALNPASITQKFNMLTSLAELVNKRGARRPVKKKVL